MIPGDNATEQEWTDFNAKMIERVPTLAYKPDLTNPETMASHYETMGRPREAQGYEIPQLEGVDNSKLDHTQSEAFKAVAHEAGLTNDQYQRVVGAMTQSNLVMGNAVAADLETDIASLQTEWGAAYADRVRQATLIAQQTKAPQALLDTLADGSLPSGTMKWLFELAQQFSGGEGLNISQDDNTLETRLDPAQAQAEVTRLLNDKDAFLPSNPNKQANQDRLVALQRMAHPKVA